jgi:O-acetylhomoserine/O-acetylserine sulfhydrylase-like pyridoxal-dependent enzyme
MPLENNLDIIRMSNNLGDAKSLITHPADDNAQEPDARGSPRRGRA